MGAPKQDYSWGTLANSRRGTGGALRLLQVSKGVPGLGLLGTYLLHVYRLMQTQPPDVWKRQWAWVMSFVPEQFEEVLNESMPNITMIFSGNVGQDPKLKSINGKEYVEFSVAVNHSNDKTTWVNVTYGNTKLMTLIKKGSKVTVIGNGRFDKRPGEDAGYYGPSAFANEVHIHWTSASPDNPKAGAKEEVPF